MTSAGGPSAEAVRIGAILTWRQHQPNSSVEHHPGCSRCTPDGCPLERWAGEVLAGERVNGRE